MTSSIFEVAYGRQHEICYCNKGQHDISSDYVASLGLMLALLRLYHACLAAFFLLSNSAC